MYEMETIFTDGGRLWMIFSICATAFTSCPTGTSCPVGYRTPK